MFAPVTSVIPNAGFVKPQATRQEELTAPAQGVPALRFSGIHPDAVVGVEVKVAGSQNAQENTRRLWFKLKNAGQVDNNYSTNVPLVLIREKQNQHDPNAVGVYAESDRGSVRRKLGYLPKELAANIAPLMDAGHKFESTLTFIKPYKKDGQWYHSLVTRLEYVTKPGRAPNAKVLRKVEQAFYKAREAQNFERVLTLLPEELNVHTLPEGGKLVERIDHEQGTASYYRKGHLLANFRLGPDQRPTPTYERKKLKDGLKAEISKLIDQLA